MLIFEGSAEKLMQNLGPSRIGKQVLDVAKLVTSMGSVPSLQFNAPLSAKYFNARGLTSSEL
jgi:hypothetical protein